MAPALPRQLVVSTHFDDAALSLAHVLQRARDRATVVTICGAPPAGDLPASEWDELSGFASGREAARARALEDGRACRLTGARRIHLRHRDGPYRAGPLRASAIRGAIERLLGGEDILWLPAGIGEHPDHIGVRAALLPLAALLPGARVRVYADLPYAGLHGFRLPRAVSSELPGLRGRDVRLRGVAFEHKLEAVRCHASQIAPLRGGRAGLARTGRHPGARTRLGAHRVLADRETGVILQVVIATEPQARFELSSGESVLWRERRTPPFMPAAIAAAGILAISGVALASFVLTPLLVASAVAALLAGRRFAAGHYLEDQLVTDRRALVVPRVGIAYGLALDDLESVELRGTKAIFTGHGREMRFGFVSRQRALRKALESGAPHISLEQRWDPNCAG